MQAPEHRSSESLQEPGARAVNQHQPAVGGVCPRRAARAGSQQLMPWRLMGIHGHAPPAADYSQPATATAPSNPLIRPQTQHNPKHHERQQRRWPKERAWQTAALSTVCKWGTLLPQTPASTYYKWELPVLLWYYLASTTDDGTPQVNQVAVPMRE